MYLIYNKTKPLDTDLADFFDESRILRPDIIEESKEAVWKAEYNPATNMGDLLADIPKGETLIIYGGDGSVNEVINAPGIKDYRLIIYPAGTGNDGAHGLGYIQKEVKEDILSGRVNEYEEVAVPIPYVHLPELGYMRFFLTVADPLFGAYLVDKVNDSGLKEFWGSLAYAVGVLKFYKDYGPVSMTVADRKFDGVIIATGGNGYWSAGRMRTSKVHHLQNMMSLTLGHDFSQGYKGLGNVVWTMGQMKLDRPHLWKNPRVDYQISKDGFIIESDRFQKIINADGEIMRTAQRITTVEYINGGKEQRFLRRPGSSPPTS